MKYRASSIPAFLLFISSTVLAHQGLEWCPDGPMEAPSPSWKWHLPPQIVEPRVPEDNPMSAAKVALGKKLFSDKRLSFNQRISCASCHQQSRAFTDGKPVSTGVSGEKTARNAQALMNVAWNTTYTWANPALTSLERQMLVPLFGESPVEMGVNDRNKEAILDRLKRDKDYAKRFLEAFPEDPSPIQWDTIIKSIASFERTLISYDSRFDRYQRGEIKLTAAELRGKALFYGEKAECFHCHGSANFNDQFIHLRTRLAETPFHNTGLYRRDEKGAYPTASQGLIEISGQDEDMGKFRAPSLRNVAVTAPYMHDGSVATLKEVIRIYAAGGRQITSGPNRGDGRLNPHKSELIGQISLSPREQADLLAFLKTLTDQRFLKGKDSSTGK